MANKADCCPTCGRTLPKPRIVAPADTAAMSDSQLFAHYKKTAPIEDVRFFLRTAILSPALRADLEQLAANAPAMTRADIYRRYVVLQDMWRRESNATETITAERKAS
jgi:hypothetical protein